MVQSPEMVMVRAIQAGSGFDSREGDDVRVDVWSIVIVDVARRGSSSGAGDRRIDGMFVCPRGVAAGLVDHAVDRVVADEVPGVKGRATVEGIARQLGGVNGEVTAVDRIGVLGAAASKFGLVDVNAFLVFDARTVGLVGSAGSAGQSVAGGVGGWREHTVVGDVIPDSG